MKSLYTSFLAAGFLLTLTGLMSGAAPKDDFSQKEQTNLQGTWAAISTKGFDKEVPREELQTLRLTFKGDHISAKYGSKTAEATFKLALNEAGPVHIDVTVTQGPEAVKGKTLLGIYLLEGDTLKILYRDSGKSRPATFMDENEPGVRTVLLTKEKS